VTGLRTPEKAWSVNLNASHA